MEWNGIYKYRVDERKEVTIISAEFRKISRSNDGLLSSLEIMRANRIANHIDRARFISSRTFLRQALGYVLGINAYRGEFIVGRFGKLYLPAPHSRLFFSLSHTKRVVIAAFAKGQAVGIDIEGAERNISPLLQDYVFLPEESRSIASAPDQRAAFIWGWVCKEAVLKCIGWGFSRGPKSICIDLENCEQENFRACDYSKEGLRRREFRLVSLTHLQNTIGAIALRERTSHSLGSKIS